MSERVLKSINNASASDSAPQCSYRSPAGRRCRLPRANSSSSLCARHARIHQQSCDAANTDPLVFEDDFSTATSVNLFLGKLLKRLADNRIDRSDAMALAYVAQLLLNSLSAMIHEQRHADGSDDKGFRLILDSPRPQRDDPLPPPNPYTGSRT